MSVMEAIFNGKVYPLEQVVAVPPKVGEMEKSIDGITNELQNRIGNDEMDRLTKIRELFLQEADVIAVEYFRFGLSLGIEMTKESKDVLNYFKVENGLELGEEKTENQA
ncbi:MAG: hypothetical protein LUD16_08245 [Lachnospiraceae bacterium]|nr:hypothetical protein [Lachnospiraceae bacterium]